MLNLFQWTMILTLKQLGLVPWRGVCLIVYEDIINVKNVPKLMRSLISLGVLDTLGYDFFLYRMELWILIKVSQNLQNLPVESHLEKSYVNAKEVVTIEKHGKMLASDEKYKEKMIKTSFSTKDTCWHKDETNCKNNEVIKKTKTRWEFELDTCLLLLIAQQWHPTHKG